MNLRNTIVLTILILVTACTFQQAGPFSNLSDEELSFQYRLAEHVEPKEICGTLLPISEEILRRDPSDEGKLAARNYADFQCAYNEKRWQEAYASMLLVEKDSGTNMGFTGFFVAKSARRYPDAIHRLQKMTTDDDPSQLLNIKSQMFWDLYRNLSYVGRDDLKKSALDAIANSTHFYLLDTVFKPGIASEKLKQDAANGVFNDADKWISELTSAFHFSSILADKKFKPIWPSLERAVGPNFVDINDRGLKLAMDTYYQNPSDPVNYQIAATELLYSGKFEELIEFVKTPTDTKLRNISEHEAWALNEKVRALHSLGRHQEGMELFEKLATIPVSDENRGWLISFTINRSSDLVGHGEWQRGYDATIYAEGFPGSAFAKMLIRRNRACALVGLGKEQIASILLNQIFEHREDGYAAAAGAMMCAGMDHIAAEIVLEALNDKDHRPGILSSLQKPDLSFYPDWPALPNLHSLLEKNADVKTEFEKHGRLIPDEFIPLAAIRRLQ